MQQLLRIIKLAKKKASNLPDGDNKNDLQSKISEADSFYDKLEPLHSETLAKGGLAADQEAVRQQLLMATCCMNGLQSKVNKAVALHDDSQPKVATKAKKGKKAKEADGGQRSSSSYETQVAAHATQHVHARHLQQHQFPAAQGADK